MPDPSSRRSTTTSSAGPSTAGWPPGCGRARARITGWCGPRSRCFPLVDRGGAGPALPAQGRHRRLHPHGRLGRGWPWWPLLYAASLGALYALRMVEAYLMALTGQRVMHDLRATLFAHLLKLEAGFFDRTPVGRLMTRVLSDVEAVSEAFTSGLFAIVADVVTLVGVVAIMLWMDWRLALVTFAIVPVLFGVAGYLRHPRARRLPRGPPPAGPAQRLPAGVASRAWRSSSSSAARSTSGDSSERLNQDYRRAPVRLHRLRGVALRHGGGAGLAGAGAAALVRRRRRSWPAR